MLHSPYCATLQKRGEIDDKIFYSIFELIRMKRWKEARQHVEQNPESVYSICENKRRMAIHELCQLVLHPVDPEIDGELSDDEEEDTHDVREPCFACLKNENKHVCELVQFLIDTSFSLGPARIARPPADDERGEEFDNSNAGFDIHESILTVEDSYKKTPLHILCEHSADTQMMKVIFDNTKENNHHPCAPSASSLITSTDTGGSTPLHYLSYSRCPFSTLQLMMDHCETTSGIDPTLCEDSDGDTPLHWALDGCMSARRIAQLLRHSKAALRIQNEDGNYPFDHFGANFVNEDWHYHDSVGREGWEAIQAYLKVLVGWEEAPGSEWLPLLALASSPFNLPGVFHDIAVQYNEGGLSQSDSKGWLPLHLACARENTAYQESHNGSRAFVYLPMYPQAAYRPTNDTKQLPLHIAIMTRKPLTLITRLLAVYPSSLSICDPCTGLWPFLLAGSKNSDNVTMSYSLLRADPSIMQSAIRKLVSKKGISAEKALRKIAIDDLEEFSAKHVAWRRKLAEYE